MDLEVRDRNSGGNAEKGGGGGQANEDRTIQKESISGSEVTF